MTRQNKSTGGRLSFDPYFTKSLEDRITYDSFKWKTGDVKIKNDAEVTIFVQKGVESPVEWSELARQVCASRYFFGAFNSNERENSMWQLVGRVANKFSGWVDKDEYFSHEDSIKFGNELTYLALNQYMAFNSPVWFNTGIDSYGKHAKKKDKKYAFIINDSGNAVTLPVGKEYVYPQTSACFIQSVNDTMEDIMDLAKKEAMLFKYGSGTGSDLSNLRSSREDLTGGGTPSGPLKYLMFYDRVGGIVQSGGKTRRAAKMDTLKDFHPDILEFIQAKAKEQIKIGMLIAAGLNPREAIETVAYQNANLSVRLSDNFMNSVENDEDWQTIAIHSKHLQAKMPKYKAKMLFREIAKGAHACGDPGVQFHDTINKWHTCPNTAPINASNPCSEYMFLDNSACNLASLKLTKFLPENGVFDTEEFMHVARATAIAQDVEIDNSSYPATSIALNAHKYRPLGTGYADLGALLMRLGVAYDSDEGRAVAASLASLLTGVVYKTSAEMAKEFGPFEGYEKNKEPMLNVMKMHRAAKANIDRSKLPKGLESVLEEADKVWGDVIKLGKKYGFRNAQATVLAPTGTIGFMMDCDTTGVEPDLGLVKYKLLAEGGRLKIVNQSIEPALKRLGYDEKKIKEIMDYIMKKETIEGAPGLKSEHLSIFDCSLKSKNGERFISYQGHLKMMAAIQPFISGAISKTVNLPGDITIEEMEQLYKESWKMGLKSVAVYRDGSKANQPLSVSAKLEKHKPVRRKLPTTRPSITHKFNVADHEGYLTIGLYEDKSPGELFITMSKEGSIIGGTMDAFGTAISLGLQYGVPLKQLTRKFKDMKYEPRGLVLEGHKEIPEAKSIIDYIFRFMEKTFPDKDGEEDVRFNHLNELEEVAKGNGNNKNSEENENTAKYEKGNPCPICGEPTEKRGDCIEICSDCRYINPRGCGG